MGNLLSNGDIFGYLDFNGTPFFDIECLRNILLLTVYVQLLNAISLLLLCRETFTVFTLSTFSSVVDIVVGLESDGYIAGFMSNYLKNGEPYLTTPYGTVICYWDGTVHYALYLFMLTAMACRFVTDGCIFVHLRLTHYTVRHIL